MFSPPLHRKPIPHGTYSGYRYWGCRCTACKQMNAAGQRANRTYRKAHGLCAFGSHPSRPGMSTCLKCGAAASAKRIAQMRAKQQKGQAA